MPVFLRLLIKYIILIVSVVNIKVYIGQKALVKYFFNQSITLGVIKALSFLWN